MLEELPEEIRTDILSRLPFETLVRCVCASESLLSLLTSQAFIDAYIKRTNLNHLLLRYCSEDGERHFFLQPDEDSFHGEFLQSVEFPLYFDDDSYSMLGSIKGVVCLYYKYNGTILWNPSIKKWLSIPSPQLLVEMDEDSETIMGFGFDPQINDYKLVHIFFRGGGLPPMVEVYTVSSGFWRPTEGPVPVRRVADVDGWQCYCNGVVHWLGMTELEGYCITTFRVHDDVFGEMAMPESLAKADSDATYIKLDACGDTLASIAYYVQLHSCAVWIMNDYGMVDSWTPKYLIDLQRCIPCRGALTFRDNAEVIMSVKGEDARHFVLWCDQGRPRINALEMIDEGSHGFILKKYVKSFTLYKEGNGYA